MDLGLKNSRVLVTGSSRGIGNAIAAEFLEEGASVLLTGRNETALHQARDALAARFGAGAIEAFAGDLSVPGVRQRLRDTLLPTGLDHLVCNVGSGRSVPPLEETPEEWQRMLDINLLQAAALIRDLQGVMATKRGASVTFVGSICGTEAIGCPLAYASAKAALWAYAKNLVRPLAKPGIRVNMVSPGNVLFDGSVWESKLAGDATGVQAMLDREVPMRRLGSVNEIAAAVVFLASRRASFITGANLIVDGGQTRGM